MNRLLAISLIAACGTSPDHPYGDHLGTPENPIPEQGVYAVTSTVDFTVEAVLPGQAAAVVAVLREFSQNPAKSLVLAADKAGVPGASTFYDVIPSPLRGRVEGWINDEVAKIKINGKSLQQYAGDVAGLADTALRNFALDSSLEIDGFKSTHTLTALDLTPAGIDFRVPIGGFAGDILTQHPELFIAEGGAFSLGDQHFGLLIGEYLWTGINAGATALYGKDIPTAIESAVNCPTIASTVADKCVLGVCVGHESMIREVCQGGITAVVDQMHAQFSKLNLEAFRFIAGQGLLVDDDGDGVGDRIINGLWDAEMNIGLGLRHAPATFTATR